MMTKAAMASPSPMPELKTFARRPELRNLTMEIMRLAEGLYKQPNKSFEREFYLREMARKLNQRGKRVRRKLILPASRGSSGFDRNPVLDLLVENQVLIEIKTMKRIFPIHDDQMKTWLKMGAWPLGLLINFGADRWHHAIRQYVSQRVLLQTMAAGSFEKQPCLKERKLAAQNFL